MLDGRRTWASLQHTDQGGKEEWNQVSLSLLMSFCLYLCVTFKVSESNVSNPQLRSSYHDSCTLKSYDAVGKFDHETGNYTALVGAVQSRVRILLTIY